MITQKVCIGIDIGGTNIEVGYVNSSGEVIFKRHYPTKSFQHPDLFIRKLQEDVTLDRDLHKLAILGVGIGAPSGNYFTGSIEHAPNMPWDGIIPLARLVQDATGLPTLLTNDANAATVGEMQFGSAKGLRNFILITLGTGVGSGFVSNGELIYGHDGFAGELGHVIVRENGRVCGCGRLGCVETYCSATGVVLTAKEKLSQSLKSELHQIPIHELNSANISKAAGNGDVLALEVIDETARILAIALANAVAITSPDHIFIYGGLSHAGEILLQPLRKYFDSFLLKNYRNKVKILPSGLPDEAAICGAAALAWNKI